MKHIETSFEIFINEEFFNFKSIKQLRMTKYDELETLIHNAEDIGAYMGGLSIENLEKFVIDLVKIFNKYDFSEEPITNVNDYINHQINTIQGNGNLFWNEVKDEYNKIKQFV